MITNIENSKESPNKLIIINSKAFSKVSGYKCDEQSSVVFLDSSNQQNYNTSVKKAMEMTRAPGLWSQITWFLKEFSPH
jgi:hypothetical protein